MIPVPSARLVLTLLVSGVSGLAVAQSYPAKSIRMIIPAAPGGGVDTIGRALGQKLTESLASRWWRTTARAPAR